jgi:hypothetical protein
MSMSKYITLSSSIPIYNALLNHLEKIIENDSDFSLEIINAAKKGYEKLKLYYIKTDESYIYSIATSKFFFIK